ncbi:SH3 domain-containing protein [Mesobacillus zeae]|uniref:Peptide-binding protein n=1 Tax=Mesobacillus zeae TaxID=1917180 RepID=A0A398AVV9_9BACI|nr:SH3 domain-containing protein [Mesobacillus zeae]RID81742.1 peptide-binding protein [Mesobacillus zeae]
MKKKIALVFFTCLLLLTVSLPGFSSSIAVKAAGTVKIAKTAYITTNNLNLRTGSATKFPVIVTIPKGKTVIATERLGGWYKVSYTYKVNGKYITKTGWVSGTYLKKPVVKAPAGTKIVKTTFVTTANLNIRSGAGTKFKTVYTVRKGQTVSATEKIGSWYKISHSYKVRGKNITVTGWVSGSFLKEYYQYIKTSRLDYFTKKVSYFYQTPDTKRKPTVKIPGNTRLQSTQKVINSIGQTWYRVSYKGKSGYVNSADVTRNSSTPPINQPVTPPDEPKWTETSLSGKTFVTTDSLNVRSKPFSTGKLLNTLPDSKLVVPAKKTSNGWYKVTYQQKTGYVSGKYLKEVITGDPMTRKGYQFIDLRTKSPVTASQINHYIAVNVKAKGKPSVLLNKGQAFINAGNKYGVNALYLAAHAIHESGYGTSNISLGKYNLFGFGAFDLTPFVGAYRFSSIEQNIDYIAREMKATYLNPHSWKYKGAYLGFTTKSLSNSRLDANSEGMNFYYASDSFWGKAIASHMERILPYNENYYRNAKPNLTYYSQPGKPGGKDVFPADTQAVSMNTLVLSLTKGGPAAKTLKKGNTFTLLEKHNDYWLTVKVGGKTYYAGVKNSKATSPIPLHAYRDYFTVKNLGRVTVDGLNFRSQPSMNGSRIDVLKRNQYVHLLLDKNGKPIVDKSGSWYNIKLANGKKGWASKSFIEQELK